MNDLWLALGLGLLGFVEPCTMGSNLILVKHLDRRAPAARMTQMLVYAATRGLFMGLLGWLAAFAGAWLFGAQRGLWIALGGVYLLLGAIYLAGRRRWLMVSLGPSFARLSGTRGSAALGVLFGLNVPACAAPLIFVLLGLSTARGASGAAQWQGFLLLFIFGLALSAPLVLAVAWERARRALDWLASWSVRAPRWTGAVLAALGLWSIGFGLFAHLHA
ncbi:MAG: cytochrome c biogenesis CcdA family protein [Gammaproteobacteria bacterium]